MSKESELQQAEKINIAIPTSRYSDQELAHIYNQARVDYIVPMPMNARRMRDYITNYDIDINASLVAVDRQDNQPNGICMLGVRDDRTWITRLGVIPHRRRRYSGQFLMQALIDYSKNTHKRLMQLEVIKNNEPAYQLFKKLGFQETRELLIIRRPPGKLPLDLEPNPTYSYEEIPAENIEQYLHTREAGASWVEETSSLLNAGNLRGFTAKSKSSETGWIIFQESPFQLTHFVVNNQVNDDLIGNLIAKVHATHPLQDTKIENMPENDRTWSIFQKYGYVEAFRRIEMFLYF